MSPHQMIDLGNCLVDQWKAEQSGNEVGPLLRAIRLMAATGHFPCKCVLEEWEATGPVRRWRDIV